jgi:pimeloyl-ACP methyl ester carboxylesterase
MSKSSEPVVLEETVGRYVHLTAGGVRYRIYFEEAGSGPVLLCLHTAGADSRQFRQMINDRELTSRYRVIAFDLPWHGRSLPPDGWWREEYLLTTDSYLQIIHAFADALELRSPIVLGCSMAGSIVLELARRTPDRWRAVIGLSGALKVHGRFQDWSLRPDVNAQQSVPSWTYSLMAPSSPEEWRREVWWIYSQGGPGIYRGDTYFYSEDLDLTEKTGEFDTKRCPVYLFTGEYDHACTADETQEAISRISGARGGRMAGIGHFPMAENYALFREYLLPALDEISEADTTTAPPENPATAAGT